MRTLKCPECAEPMTVFFAEARDGGPRLELDRCGRCTRVWFDVKELERAVGKTFLPRLKGTTVSHGCPVCGQPMVASLIRGDVPIEECEACNGGSLLERQDFELISGTPLREVKAPPPPAAPVPLSRRERRQAKNAGSRVLEFRCERCGKVAPVAEAGNVGGATVCRSCELKPWPDQPAQYRARDWSTDALSDFIDALVNNLFR